MLPILAVETRSVVFNSVYEFVSMQTFLQCGAPRCQSGPPSAPLFDMLEPLLKYDGVNREYLINILEKSTEKPEDFKTLFKKI